MRVLRNVGIALGLGLVALSITAPAALGSPPPAKDLCKDGGYANYTTPSSGKPFSNQGQCVSTVSRGGTIVPVCRTAPAVAGIDSSVTPPPGDTFARSAGQFFRDDTVTLRVKPTSTCSTVQTFTYAWSLARPAGSAAVLSSATASAPSFTADLPGGTWQAAVVVTDQFGNRSAPATTTLTSSACGANPILVAMNDVPGGKPFDPHTLTASATSQDDNPTACPTRFASTYTYQWAVVPGTPAAPWTLEPANAAQVTFSPGGNAAYSVSVTATSTTTGKTGTTSSIIDTFCAAPNPAVSPPIIVAGASSPHAGGDFNPGDTVTVGASVDVSACYTSPAEAQLTYSWLLSGPGAPALSNPTTATPSFTAPPAGQTIVVQVTVTDKWGNAGSSLATFLSSPGSPS